MTRDESTEEGTSLKTFTIRFKDNSELGLEAQHCEVHVPTGFTEGWTRECRVYRFYAPGDSLIAVIPFTDVEAVFEEAA
jgi:hypothetical protein